MSATATRLIIKHQNWWIVAAVQIITAVSPQIGTLGGAGLRGGLGPGPLTLARIQLRHRGFIGMQNSALAE